MVEDSSVRTFNRYFDSEKNALYLTPTEGKPTHTLIWLHGAGEPTEMYVDLFDKNGGLPTVLPHSSIQVILPTAPLTPCKWHFDGAVVPVWYNVHSFDGRTAEFD